MKKRSCLIVLSAVLLFVFLSAFMLSGCDSDDPKVIIEKYANAYFNGNAGTVADMCFFANFAKDRTKDDARKGYEEMLAANPEYWEKQKGNYKVGVFLIDDNLSEERVESFKSSGSLSDRSGITQIRRITANLSKDGGEEAMYNYLLINVNGKWYVDDQVEDWSSAISGYNKDE